jgi:NitT/TauT family transport system permease protein
LSTVPSTEARPAFAPAPPLGLWSRIPTVVRRLIVLALIVAFWQLYVSWKDVNPLVFPSAWAVAKSFWHGWANGTIWHATVQTLKVLGISMAIGVVAALVLTVLATASTIGRDLLMLLTSMINPLPAIAILPLAIIWFGLNTTALVFVIANAVTWPIAINLSMGFATVSPTIVAVGRNIGLRGVRMVSDVLAPAALPHAISGIKTAWAFGWRTIIAAELVFGVSGGKGGLGYYINNSRLFLHMDDAMAGLVTIALIGIVFDYLFTLLERRTVERWGLKSTA